MSGAGRTKGVLLENVVDVRSVLNQLLPVQRVWMPALHDVHIKAVPVLQTRAAVLQFATPALRAAVAAERALESL